MACGNTASRCARHKQRKEGCSGLKDGAGWGVGFSCVPQAFRQDRLPGVSVHWPGLVGLGGVEGELACQNCHCGQEKGQEQVRRPLLPSPPHQKATGSTGTTQVSLILAGVGPPHRLSWYLIAEAAFSELLEQKLGAGA